jgi:hypothetical protein
MKQAVMGVWAAGSWAEPRRAMCFVRAWGGRESFLVGRDRLRARVVAVRLYAGGLPGCLLFIVSRGMWVAALQAAHGRGGWRGCSDR